MLRLLLTLLVATLTASAAPEPQLPNQADANSYQRLEINRHGSRLLVGEDRRAFLWDVTRLRLIHTLKGFNFIQDMQFHPDGASLVVSDSPRWVGYYDCSGDKLVKRWEFRDPSSFKTKGDAYRLQFSPDGKYLLATGCVQGVGPHDPVVRVLESATGKVIQAYPGWSLDRAGSSGDFAFAPNSQGFVRVVKGRLQYYALPSGKKLVEVDARLQGAWLKPHPLGVLAVSSQSPWKVYSVPAFKVLEEKHACDEVEPTHPNGNLSWSRLDGKLVIKDAVGSVIYQGGSNEYVHYWVPGAGFGLNSEPRSDDFPQLRDSNGQQLGAQPIESNNLGGGIGWLEPGYGRANTLFDLSTGASLLEIPFAYEVAVSANGRYAAVLTKKGVLILDLPATLQQGQPVPKVSDR
jgi:hypothetical protein